MRSNPLAGRAGYWLHAGDGVRPTLDGVLDVLTRNRGDLLTLTCMDGPTWQQTLAPARSLRSIAEVQRVSADCAARGVAFCPVVIARGGPHEPAAYGALAAALGCLIVHMELGPGLWDRAPPESIPRYCRALRQVAGGAYLVGQLDPRPYTLVRTWLRQAVGDLDAISGLFGGPTCSDAGGHEPVWELPLFETLASLGRDQFVTLAGVAPAALPARFWRRAKDQALGYQVRISGRLDGDVSTLLSSFPPRAPAQAEPPDSLRPATLFATVMLRRPA